MQDTDGRISGFGSLIDTGERVQGWMLVLCAGLKVRQRGPFSGGEILLGLSPGRVARGFEEDGFRYTDEIANFITASTRIRRAGAKKIDPQSEEQLSAAALGMYAPA